MTMIDRQHAIDAEFADLGTPPAPPRAKRRRKRAPAGRAPLISSLKTPLALAGVAWLAGAALVWLAYGVPALAGFVMAPAAAAFVVAAMVALAWTPE
jgi:fatty acid desaturase